MVEVVKQGRKSEIKKQGVSKMLLEEDWLEDIEDQNERLLRPANEGWVQEIEEAQAADHALDDLDIYIEFEQELENDMISSAEAGFVSGFETEDEQG